MNSHHPPHPNAFNDMDFIIDMNVLDGSFDTNLTDRQQPSSIELYSQPGNFIGHDEPLLQHHYSSFDNYSIDPSLTDSFGDFGQADLALDSIEFGIQPSFDATSASNQGLPAPQTQANSVDPHATWSPRFQVPDAPCDNCGAKGMKCFFNDASRTCTACAALFRVCTFSGAHPRSTHLDTLGPVSEDAPQDTMNNVSYRPLFSHGASMQQIVEDSLVSKPERTNTRFPRTTTLILRKWLSTHTSDPYPTEQEKLNLKDQTGLSTNQISNWLANARRRGNFKKRGASPNASEPVAAQRRRQAEMDPMERWKDSPPEKEAPIALIEQAAAATSFYLEKTSISSRTPSQIRSSGGSWRPSSGSSMTQDSSSDSGYSRGSMSSRGRRRRRLSNKQRPKAAAAAAAITANAAPAEPAKMFQCTFCTDTFKVKYDWTRHEKSLHLNLEKWICSPLGPRVCGGVDNSSRCVYCAAKNPSNAHLEAHQYYECEKPAVERTFFRKDHLRQHLKLVHNVAFHPSMENWKLTPAIVRSRCGFCPPERPTVFSTFQERADHLAKHFREGAKMSQWRGGHGLDPEIAAQVTNAMPPTLIEQERLTAEPFSARAGHQGQYEVPLSVLTDDPEELSRQIQERADGGKATAPHGRVNVSWQVLTESLGQFVARQQAAGRVPSDAMLQRHARWLLYGEDDDANTTSADNSEWLRLFKQAHDLPAADETKAQAGTGFGADPGPGDSPSSNDDGGRRSHARSSTSLSPEHVSDGDDLMHFELELDGAGSSHNHAHGRTRGSSYSPETNQRLLAMLDQAGFRNNHGGMY